MCRVKSGTVGSGGRSPPATTLSPFTFGEWGDEKQGFKKTGKESISRYLLDYWHYDLKALGA